MPLRSRSEDPEAYRRVVRLGRAEIATLLRGEGGQLTLVALFAAVVNLLMLTGPLFMLQVYDRVLPAHSYATLTSLFSLVIFLFAIMGVLDWARGRLLARIGADLQLRLEQRVFDAAVRRGQERNQDISAHNALRDLELVQHSYGTPIAAAWFDLPWTPLYLGVLFVFHPWLGMLATAGGLVLVLLSGLTQYITRDKLHEAGLLENRSRRIADDMLKEIDTITSLGMRLTGFDRWRGSRHKAMSAAIRASDLSGSFHSLIRTLRMLLQSTMLALGAYLVLQSEVTAGAMVAGSIVMGRALAPIEQVISGWTSWSAAHAARTRLALLLGATPPVPARKELARPAARLAVEDIAIVPPRADQPVLELISFTLEPGEALGVIGPVGAGKSLLSRALCHNHPPAAGEILLDEISLNQYDPDHLGRLIGYLPQTIALFDGTVAQNIARLNELPDMEQVIKAAKRAGAHRMILDLPERYDTRVDPLHRALSGRQRHQIGLARALYGDPVLLVLDEPDLNLSNDAGVALHTTIRALKARGGAAIVMANSPATLAECERVLVLDQGAQRALGPRDEILKRLIASTTRTRGLPLKGTAA